MMTSGRQEPDTTAEDRFLADLFPQVTEHLANQ